MMEIKIEGNKIKCDECGHKTTWSFDTKKGKHIGGKCSNCGEDLLKYVDKEIFKPQILH